MKAIILFSNKQRVTVDGVEGLNHAEAVANILASRYSAGFGKAVYVETVQINRENFSCNPSDEYWMEGVTVISSVDSQI
jgi:hypothetical protein